MVVLKCGQNIVGRIEERKFDIGGERESEQRHSDSHSKGTKKNNASEQRVTL